MPDTFEEKFHCRQGSSNKKGKMWLRCQIPLKRSFRAHVGAPISSNAGYPWREVSGPTWELRCLILLSFRAHVGAQMPDTLEEKFQGPRGSSNIIKVHFSFCTEVEVLREDQISASPAMELTNIFHLFASYCSTVSIFFSKPQWVSFKNMFQNKWSQSRFRVHLFTLMDPDLKL